ncbi:hypothetical protein SAMN04244560_00859 [Thermoanaerobacter thermohydrosulfuricus]|uniref:Uncharacterized protein n=1 Tax=Thermoanaerobacter thermohydrosulfuricus TaxID=1516 RepID=A0A1G7LRW2_THETY|nr:hypothetical protein [Thermoanaerobacter thermohydrosulfuricus]SDF52252.1 hypothetical protein SAMN04244560_00859 [Thermoanaerobacter thermohydrosulfuricus]
MKKQEPIVVWKIKCSGHYHKIGISPKGKLIFFNHSKEEIKTERILEKMTSRKSINECYNFAEAFKKYIKPLGSRVEDIPLKYKKRFSLSNYVVEQQNKAVERFLFNRDYNNLLKEENNFWLKIRNRIHNNYEAKIEIESWARKQLQSKTDKNVTDKNVSVWVNLFAAEQGEEPGIGIKTRIVEYNSANIEISSTITVSIKWYIAYKKGFAFVDDFFIVDVIQKINNNKYAVRTAQLVLKDDANIEVILKDIEVEKDQSGTWHCSTKEKAKKEENHIILEASLRCSGHIHKVGITNKGDVIFFNHTKQEIRNEAILEKVTGIPSTCQCYNFLKDYRKVVKGYSGSYFSSHTQVHKKIFNSNHVKAAQRKNMYRRYNDFSAAKNFSFLKYIVKKAWKELYITFGEFLSNNPNKDPNNEYRIVEVTNIDVPESFYYKGKHSNTPQIFWIHEEGGYGIERYFFTIHYSYKWYLIYKKFYDILKDFFIISIKEKVKPDTYVISGLYINESGEPIIADAKIEKIQNSWRIQLLSKGLSI